MIHVCYSHRTEELLAALGERLAAEEAAGASPFEPVPVVVPNRNIEAYLKLGLAQARGIAANLEIALLRELLARLALRAVPGARLVTVRQLEGYLLALLGSADRDPALAPVWAYLGQGGHSERRRCQLAAELARLFDEYTVSRAEMLAGWAAGRAAVPAGDPAAATEAWQRVLWARIFGADGLVATQEGPRGTTLPELVAAASGGFDPAARALHVFGLSYMAPGYHRMLAALARTREVRIYTLNPCREFWEDVETTSELRRRLRRSGGAFPRRAEARQPGLALDDDPLGLTSEGEMLALRLWGRPGRENVRLLNQLTDGDFEGRFADGDRRKGPPRTLLERLQRDVVDRVARSEPPALSSDGSVAVLRCPGLRRELEVVAAEIWRLVRADPGLELRDIAVVVPEGRKDLYLPQVAAVFGEACDLPHSVVDLPVGGRHRLAEAALMLLALPTGSFSRSELLPLLTHPSLMARFPEASPSHWLRLCDELGIVHGADHRDHAGTYIDRDLLNWDQGLRRLALGALMAGPRSGDETPVRLGDEQYLPADLPPDAARSALDFALLARSLLADARFATGQAASDSEAAAARRPLPEWLELIRGLWSSYLVPADDEEQALLVQCLAVLDELEEVQIVGLQGVQAVPYEVAAELAERALGALGGARGQYLARGVQVASFLPMRAIPFRVIFVLGLGHGMFPAAVRRPELDLRQARRAAGDVSPREQDLYLFLETLLSARERLVLSYVARDELTGEPLPPSSVLLELRELLASYLPPAELAALFEGTAPPLRRYDDEPRLPAAPLARREQRARALGRSLRQAVPGGADLRATLRALPPATAAALAASLGQHRPPDIDNAAAGPAGILQVPLSAIRQFLEDPLQGSARFRLGLREIDDADGLLERDEEPFESGALGRTTLLREVMVEALLRSASWPTLPEVMAIHERVALREELAGRLPTGLFRRAERPGHEGILAGWLAALEGLGERPLRQVTRFGGAAAALGGAPGLLARDEAARWCDPITLTVPLPSGGTACTVQLTGRTELLLAGPGGDRASLILSCRRDEDDRDRDRLRAFVDHLALAASAGDPARDHRALVAWARGGQHRAFADRFRPLDGERARAYLGALVADMLTGAADAAGRPTGVHDYLLPCEAVFEARRRRGEVTAVVERLRDAYFEKPFLVFSSVLGPVPEAAERHQPPPPDEAARMVGRRFDLYFDLLEEP